MTDTKIEFGTFTPVEKANPYIETVTKLNEAGENASVTLTVDATKEKAEHLLFSKAANSIDKTARLRLRDGSKIKYGPDEDGTQVATGGTVALTFTLTKRHKNRRGTKGDAQAE